MASPSETNNPTIPLTSPPSKSQQQQQQEFALARQPSIYSLTLDEFQHAVCVPGKSFGSMNMDEFLTNIWNAGEGQAVAGAMQEGAPSEHPNGSVPKGEKPLLPQPSLPRQGFLSIPAPLCRKTVEEVWSEIHKGQQQQQLLETGHPGNATRQLTFGEMTLEDFLIKAGVVRESCRVAAAPPPSAQFHQQQQHPMQPPQHQQYGYFRNGNMEEWETRYGGFGYPGHQNAACGPLAGGILAYSVYPSQKLGGDGYGNGAGGGFPGVCFGGRMGNSGLPGGFGRAQPLSPVSSDGVGPSQVVDNSLSQYGLEVKGGGPRTRAGDAHPEEGVDRRRRRMIKNRESAARSRARKQAYTLELEAELEMLKEENARLRKEREEEEVRRRKKLLEAMMVIIKTPSTKEKKCKTLQRTFTGPW